ncbi:MAG: hypothetical protein ACRDCF_01260 [Mycoplasmoidaceae bacterium]
MKKIIKLGLLGTLLSASALAIALPMVSCSSSVEDIEEDYSTDNKPLDEEKEILPHIVKDNNSNLVFKSFINASKETLLKEFVDDFIDYFILGKEYNDGEAYEFINNLFEVKDKHSDVIFKNVVDKIVVVKEAKRTTATIIEAPKIQIILKDTYNFSADIILWDDKSNIIDLS